MRVPEAFGIWLCTDLHQASSNYVSATGSGGEVNNGVFELTVTGTPACEQPVACSPELWNGTVANWADANVDDNFQTWALDLNPNAPTGTLVQGSYPTEMPRIGTGYGTINGVIGVVGQLISIASGGRQVNCQLIVGGENGQCPGPPAIEDACKFSTPRCHILPQLTKVRSQHAEMGLSCLASNIQHV